jgi:hypothetical protein
LTTNLILPIIHAIGYISAIGKSGKSIVLLRNKSSLLDLIRNLNSIISNPVYKQLQTGTLVKVSRFVAAAFTLATSTEFKEEAQKAFTNETDDKIEKALGVSKWDSTIRYFVVFASIRSFKSISIDCLIFYFFTFSFLCCCKLAFWKNLFTWHVKWN